MLENDSVYKGDIQSVLKENQRLRKKIEALEAQNRLLRSSIYALTFGSQNLKTDIHSQTYDLSQVLASVEPEHTAAMAADDASEAFPSTSFSPEIAAEDRRINQSDGRHFLFRQTLHEHDGPVFTASFSPNGQMLASGSFDRSVLVWEHRDGLATKPRMIRRMQGHQLPVLSIGWSSNSAHIVSGGVDHGIKVWDVETGRYTSFFTVPGFIQTTCFGHADPHLVFSGDTKSFIKSFDTRANTEAMSMENDSMVNSIYVYTSGEYLMSGDHKGIIKTWDIRNMSHPVVSHSLRNSMSDDSNQNTVTPSSSSDVSEHDALNTSDINNGVPSSIASDSAASMVPISHITVISAPSALHHESHQHQHQHQHPSSLLAVNSYDNILRVYEFDENKHPNGNLRLIKEFSGHKNKNYPIKSSFCSSIESNTGNPFLCCASGSTDNNVYVYDIFSENNKTPDFMQRLEGHSDKVFGTAFHPSERTMASYSSDGAINLWSAEPSGTFSVDS